VDEKEKLPTVQSDDTVRLRARARGISSDKIDKDGMI
jgi:hypothetical protein